MDEATIKSMAAELAKGLKTPEDLNQMTAVFKKFMIETALSAGRNFSHVKLPKEPSPTRKPRSDSIKAQYYANPLAFKYYDNFGIFEIYDR
ncbi:hypothetical protein [Acinetobacter baumannii]|uniref:hypothetical protein n=1 Tax=Acinetobacter baumannii TaxID=470 RepID=UPI003989A3E1